MSLGVALGIANIGLSLSAASKAKKAAKKAAQARMAMARYNANIAREEAKAKSEVIEYEAEQLTLTQRELQSNQRASVSMRGGTLAGSDLVVILNERAKMQMDNLELQRQSDQAKLAGEKEAEGMLKGAKLGAQVDRAKGKAQAGALVAQAVGQAASVAMKYDL